MLTSTLTLPSVPENSKAKTSIYMVFEYMDHDLSGLSDNPGLRFTPEQIKVKEAHLYLYVQAYASMLINTCAKFLNNVANLIIQSKNCVCNKVCISNNDESSCVTYYLR